MTEAGGIEGAAYPAGAGDYEGTELAATAHALNYNRWILEAMRPHLGRVIGEVGAGIGNFTRALLAVGPVRLIAIEPSGHLFPQLLRATDGDARVEARHGALADAGADLTGALDSIVYVNVLEHIADDRAELAHAHAALAPGGTLCVFVPAHPWLGSEFDESVGHRRRYRKEELIARVRASGFEPIEVRWFDLLGIVTWLLAFKLFRAGMRPGPVRVYDRCAVPIARFIDRLTGPPTGKSLLLIARKARQGGHE